MMSAVKSVGILIAIITISLFLLYFYIVTTSRKVRRQQAYYEAYCLQQEKNWHNYLMDGMPVAPEMLPQKPGEFLAVEYICSTYLRLVKDEEIHTRITQFATQYLTERYKKQLQSKVWSTRMNALRYIGLFGVTTLVEPSRQLLNKKITREERFEVIQLLALQDTMALLDMICKESLQRNEYRRLFMSLSPEALVKLFQQLWSLPNEAQLLAVQVAAERRNPLFLPYVNELLQSEESELRIGGLKIVYELGASLPIERLAPFATATSYVERLYAVKNLNFTFLYDSLPYLQNLIRDENWYVRREAAYVLCQSDEGIAVLESIVANSTDPYAVEVSMQLLNEGGRQHG